MGKRFIIGLYLFVTVMPLLLGLGYSLLYSLGLTGLMRQGFTLQHWVRLWGNSDALSSLAYSLYLTVASLVLILAPALLIAWWQHQRKGGRYFYQALFLPLTFPPLIAAFSWYYLLSPGGLFSRLAYQADLIGGVDGFPRLVNDGYGIGILLTHVFLVFPLFALLFTNQATKEQMDELENVSRTLGASNRYFLWRVFVPLVLKRSSPLIVLYGIFLLGAYEVPLLLGRSSPRMVTIFITEKMTKYNLLDIPLGHAMAVVYTLIILVLTGWLLRNNRINLFGA